MGACGSGGCEGEKAGALGTPQCSPSFSPVFFLLSPGGAHEHDLSLENAQDLCPRELLCVQVLPCLRRLHSQGPSRLFFSQDGERPDSHPVEARRCLLSTGWWAEAHSVAKGKLPLRGLVKGGKGTGTGAAMVFMAVCSDSKNVYQDPTVSLIH